MNHLLTGFFVLFAGWYVGDDDGDDGDDGDDFEAPGYGVRAYQYLKNSDSNYCFMYSK